MHLFFSNPQKNKPTQKKRKKNSSLHSSFGLKKHAGQNRGWTSRVSQQPYLATDYLCTQVAQPSLLPTDWASTPEIDHTGQEKSSADRCGPPSGWHPVLVILWVELGGYLFLHEPQLITQVVVGFHELLDLGFGGRECIFHLHVFLHSNGAI